MDQQEPPEGDAGQCRSQWGHVYSVNLGVCLKPRGFFLVPFTPFTYSVFPAPTDREPGSGHIWMQFAFKLTLKKSY